MHVHEEGAARDDLWLLAAPRQQPALFRRRADRPHHGNRRGASQNPTDSGKRSRTRLVAKGKRSGRLMGKHTDANRLKLKLTHRLDLNDPISSIEP